MTLSLPSVYTILPGVSFAKTLVQSLWDEYAHDVQALSDVQIYLPNRRSCRAMADMFLRISDGKATLLPRLTPIGDIDEEDLFETDPFVLDEDPFLTPSIPPLERQMILARLILARDDQTLSTTEAFRLAGELGAFLDRAHTEDIDLTRIDDLVTGDLAEHWQKTSQFLSIIVHEWPRYLEQNTLSDPAQRRNIMLQKKIASLRSNPPQHRVIAAGSTGSIALTAQLLDVIARLPNGCVILPGLDPQIPDSLWDAIDVQHPLYYQKSLVERMAIDRRTIQLWPQSIVDDPTDKIRQARRVLTQYALQPKEHFDLVDAHITKQAIDGLHLIAADNPLHEARIIALQLREILDTPEKTALIVTPDRQLARTIQQEMLRWNVNVNDSAGYDLTASPLGQFLYLIAEYGLHPYPATHILSLLRHPLTTLNRKTAERLQETESLEYVLRESFVPQNGLKDFPTRKEIPILNDVISVFEEHFLEGRQPLSAWVERHIHIAEHLAAQKSEDNEISLWRGDDGEAAAQLLHQLHQTTQTHSLDLSAQDYLSFIFQAMRQITVRPRFGQHPRIQILSPVEARLQDADHIFLAGLNETIWPALTSADPWLSRLMKRELGFGSPDRRIGQSALDFYGLFCMPHVTVTWSKNRDGVLAHASCWLQQTFAVLKKNDLLPAFEAHPSHYWAQVWDTPQHLNPHSAPSYAPPVTARPRRMSVTAIETWLKEPYTIYAKYILKLRPLDMLDNEPGAREWGNAAHAVVERFMDPKTERAATDHITFDRICDEVLRNYPLSLSQEKAWRTKLSFIRDAFIASEHENEANHTETERTLSAEFPLADGTSFTLQGRADRIDHNGSHIRITDYKTGSPPSAKRVSEAKAPQLPLLGALARASFPEATDIDFQYIQMKGRQPEPLKTTRFKEPDVLIDKNMDAFSDLLAKYYSAPFSYTAQLLHPNDFDDYHHLRRVAEWATLSESDDDDNGEDA